MLAEPPISVALSIVAEMPLLEVNAKSPPLPAVTVLFDVVTWLSAGLLPKFAVTAKAEIAPPSIVAVLSLSVTF